MKYTSRVNGTDTGLSIEREGLRYGSTFLDFAEVKALCPINHRILIDTLSDERLEISMLGFSYDGFWKELMDCYGSRCLESLFVEENTVMCCEGEYQLPEESGRGSIYLYPDAICILPQSCHAVRIPLCFTKELSLDGYILNITMLSGRRYAVGRMGYDTKPFAERTQKAADTVKKQRSQVIKTLSPQSPFTECGIFRTGHPEQHWEAAFGKSCCSVELFTGEQTATYLYRYSEDNNVFLQYLSEAMEAVGVHREIIYCSEEQLKDNPLYRMSVQRSEAVCFLRERSDGRLIHNSSHADKLKDFLAR